MGKNLYAGAPPVALREADPSRGCRRFVDRTAVVTAAARGIGFATAARLAAEGARVWITDRDESALTEAREAAMAAGLTLHAQVLDSLDSNATAQAFAAIVAEAGAVDILINNAGGSLHTPYRLLDESDEDWQVVLDLNVLGAVRAARAVLPGMTARGWGRIVNFGSKAGRFGSLIAGPNYAAAKGAVAALTRQMAMEYGPHGITVNCICPGVVMTERASRLWSERRTAEEREQVKNEIPLRRHCETEDVAASVAFLASDDAAFITGVTLDLNGGQGMS
jgi:NAD(P)-dependent dehydrogenase (short-subunit alcohol dehydrogenase family)